MAQFPARQPVTGKGFTKTEHSDTYAAIDPATKSDYSGRAILITGASKGVGRATAISAAAAGAAYIALTARSSLDDVTEAISAKCKSLNKPSPEVLCLKMDVTSLESVEAAASEVQKAFGRLDILYNNAGYLSEFGPITETDPKEWWKTWETNVLGVYYATRAFLPLLLKTEDGLKTVVNTSSVGSFGLRPGASSYQPSKTAVFRFTEFVQLEYQDQGILAFNIHPGAIMTDLASNMPSETHEILKDTPELAADAFVFLTHKRREWLGARYVSVTWDMPEFLAMEREIVEGDKLRMKLVV